MKKTSTRVILGKCEEELPRVERQFDLIFADPPYNLSGEGYMTTASGKRTRLDKGGWDKIENLHEFNKHWIKLCANLLTPTGTLWISGTLHNHPSIGMALKEAGLWIINDVIWYKPNATPLLAANRLAPSIELIWAASRTKKFFFDYGVAKKINGGKQMRNLWTINSKRHVTTHPTEKPEELLERILLIGTKPGDWVLDPFVGSGTTGVVAKRLGRNFLGIDADREYAEIARARIKKTSVAL